MTIHKLTAERTPTTTLSFAPTRALTAAEVDVERRTISGLLIPWEAYGATSAGKVRMRSDDLQLPTDLSRVKLFDQHSHDGEGKPNPNANSVGYLATAEVRPEGLWGRYQLDDTDEATKALLKADQHTNDGLSVELSNLALLAGGYVAGYLDAVALVPVPAFTDARVDRVAASQHQPNGGNMHCNICGHEHDASVVCTPEAPYTPPAAPAAPAATPAPAAPAAVAQQAPAAGSALHLPAAGLQAGAVPAGLQAQAMPTRDAFMDWTLRDFYGAVARNHAMNQQPDRQLTAALADITQTANSAVAQPAFVGELWSGVRYKRKIVPLLSPGTLTSYRVNGWRWATKPVMAAYAGDKANVPSNAADTEAAGTDAVRLAGAHDIDRKFRDFGDTAFFESYYQALAESYARLSDAAAVDFIEANATDIAAPATPGLLAAIAAGVSSIDTETDADSTFVLLNKADLNEWVLATTNFDMPAHLELLGVDLSRIKTHASVTAGHVLVGTRDAVTFYELGETPIRVEAIDMVKGGVDAGAFGYYAMLLHDAGGLADVTIGTE